MSPSICFFIIIISTIPSKGNEAENIATLGVWITPVEFLAALLITSLPGSSVSNNETFQCLRSTRCLVELPKEFNRRSTPSRRGFFGLTWKGFTLFSGIKKERTFLSG